SRSCSALVAYRSWPVTPRRIQTACGGVVLEPRLTSRWLAVAKLGPRMASSLSIFQFPVAPATKAACTIPAGFALRSRMGPLRGHTLTPLHGGCRERADLDSTVREQDGAMGRHLGL